MRDPCPGDVIAAARALLALPANMRQSALFNLMHEANVASAHACRGLGPHPHWGDGSLMSAALRRRVLPEPPLVHRDYLTCLALVYSTLSAQPD